MPAVEGRTVNDTILPFGAWMENVRGEFDAVASNPNAYPYSAPLARAIQVNFGNERGGRLARILYEAHPERSAPEAYRLIRSAYVAQLLRRDGVQFPDDYRTAGHCLEGLRWAERTYPYGNRLTEIFQHRDLSTTVWRRYATMKFLGQVMVHRNGGEGRKRGDIGCSDFTGSLAVKASDIDPEFHFSDVEVLYRQDGQLVASKEARAIFDEVISQRDNAALTVGVDRFDPSDPKLRDFVAGSMTPEEIKDGTLPSGHQKLLRLSHLGVFRDHLRFVRADITHKKGVERAKQAAGGHLDEAYMIVAWHQGDAERRRKKDEGMHSLIKRDGIVVYADFANLVETNRGVQMTPQRKWRNLNVIVSASDEKGKRRLFNPFAWTDGRCGQVRFTKDLVELAQGGPYEEHARLLADAA